ncbi:MAG: SDR family oxidoreductase [Terriglobales bacterium]
MSALEGKVAVVTGASRGIGKAMVFALAAQGTTLCLVGRRPETLQAVAEAIREKTQEVVFCPADLSDEAEVNRLVADIRDKVKRVDILIHCAGVIHLGPLESASIEDMDEHYRTNVRAPYVMTQGLIPLLEAAKGQIVFVNSSAGLSARANAGQYAASKHALKAVADSLREEVNPVGVRVLSLFLGRTASRMQASVAQMEGKTYQPELLIQPEDVASLAIHALCLPRSVEVTEISMRPLLKSY